LRHDGGPFFPVEPFEPAQRCSALIAAAWLAALHSQSIRAVVFGREELDKQRAKQ
jgi:hypothetical protein